MKVNNEFLKSSRMPQFVFDIFYVGLLAAEGKIKNVKAGPDGHLDCMALNLAVREGREQGCKVPDQKRVEYVVWKLIHYDVLTLE